MKRFLAMSKDPRFLEVIRYGIVGVLTTVVSWGSLWLLCYPFGWDPYMANVASILLAVIFAYAVNKLFVFRTHCENAFVLVREMLSFFAARGLTMILEDVGFRVAHGVMQLSPMLSKIMISVFVLVANYVLSKLFVFRKKDM